VTGRRRVQTGLEIMVHAAILTDRNSLSCQKLFWKYYKGKESIQVFFSPLSFKGLDQRQILRM